MLDEKQVTDDMEVFVRPQCDLLIATQRQADWLGSNRRRNMVFQPIARGPDFARAPQRA